MLTVRPFTAFTAMASLLTVHYAAADLLAPRTTSDVAAKRQTSSTTTSQSSSSQLGCPTVTLTSDLCQTCTRPMCAQLIPLTLSCNCPSVIPTVFISHGCDQGCSGIGCQVEYAMFTVSNCSDLSTATANSSTTSTNATATSTKPGTITDTAGSTTTGPSGSRTPSAPSSTSSPNAAGRFRPFWAVWI